MRRNRNRGRQIHGVLVVDKPTGPTSNDVVQFAKRLFNARKVGHTGSLDPLATGVLPLCFGEATKFSQYLLESDKVYLATLKLGVRTATGDSEGEILNEARVPEFSEADIETALTAYRGEIDQVPSMFSALKHNGQPLYKLARKGIEVEREARRVKIFSNEIMAHTADTLTLKIHCSKGTYVRSIADDLGQDLGCGAHVSALRRIKAGPFCEEESLTCDELELAKDSGGLDQKLQPVASAVQQWPEINLNHTSAYYVKQGQPVQVAHAPTEGWVRISEQTDDTAETRFLGVGEILDDGRVAPRRLVASK